MYYLPTLRETIFQMKQTLPRFGKRFSNETDSPTLRETIFQMKQTLPHFGKRFFKRNRPSHASGKCSKPVF